MSTIAKYPRATLLTIYSLGIFLGLLHIFFGIVSLSPMISPEYHREMKISFNAYSKSLSFLHQFVDQVTLALYLRYCISGLQLLFGTLVLENYYFGKLSHIANYGLICVDLNLLFLQICVKTSFERIAPTVVFLVLLVARLIIFEQGASKRTGKGGAQSRNAAKPKTSTPKKNKNE